MRQAVKVGAALGLLVKCENLAGFRGLLLLFSGRTKTYRWWNMRGLF